MNLLSFWNLISNSKVWLRLNFIEYDLRVIWNNRTFPLSVTIEALIFHAASLVTFSVSTKCKSSARLWQCPSFFGGGGYGALHIHWCKWPSVDMATSSECKAPICEKRTAFLSSSVWNKKTWDLRFLVRSFQWEAHVKTGEGDFQTMENQNLAI